MCWRRLAIIVFTFTLPWAAGADEDLNTPADMAFSATDAGALSLEQNGRDLWASHVLPEEALGFESLRLSAGGDGERLDHRFGQVRLGTEKNEFYFPMYRQERLSGRNTRLDGWGVRWKHYLSDENSFEVAARRSSNLYGEDVPLQDTTSTMASLSWTSRVTGDGRSSLTGSVFLGDETEADDKKGRLGRKYYGLEIGGRFSLSKRHTPYLSLKLQKSDFVGDEQEGTLQGLQSDYYSRVSAGWNWRVLDNWSLQAEANYSFSDPELNWQFDRSRIYFGTRYDFR